MSAGWAWADPHAGDNVVRLNRFRQAHPEVKVTLPAENGTGMFIATWPHGGDVRRELLGSLLSILEAAFRDSTGGERM